MKIERQKYTMEELQIFADYYNSGNSLAKTAEKFGINYHTLKKNLTKHGFRKPVRRVKNTVKNDELINNYFKKIDTHEKAYFLGLLYADGYICQGAYDTSKTVGIALQTQDKYILEYFKEEIKSGVRISEYKNSAKFAFTSKEMYEDLIDLGLKEGKSNKDYNFPKIDEEFHSSFILGYFDGDGCITIKTSGAIVVSICCNSDHFLKQIQEILLKVDIETRLKNEQGKRKNPLYVLYLKGRPNQLELMNLMYGKSKIYLNRKHNKFLQIPDKKK